MAEPIGQMLERGINYLHETFVMWDAEDRLIFCNTRFKEVNAAVADLLYPGTTYEAILRGGLAKGCYPDAAGQIDGWLRDRLERHRQPRSLFEVARQDGLWLLVDEQLLEDGTIVAIATDITEQKRAEGARAASEARFRQHASAISDWLWEIDTERRYTFVSDTIEDKIGRPAGQLLGMTVEASIDRLHDPAEWQPFWDAFEARQPIRDLIVRRRDPDGFTKWIRTGGIPFYDDNGKFLGYRGSGLVP